MASPFLSIIIPAFNSAATLQASLTSIAEQSFGDYEIVVMDGGSADATVQIVHDFAQGRKNVTVISEKDRGIYDAMNKGIKRANGEWLYFLGSDDLLASPEVLAQIHSAASARPVDVLYGDIIRKSDGGTFGGVFDLDRLLMKHNICHQAIFYKRSVFDRLGYYSLKYKICADWDFNIRCFKHTELVCEHVALAICLFNDMTGISSLEGDPAFYRELPKMYVENLRQIQGSLGYRIGSRISAMLALLTGKPG